MPVPAKSSASKRSFRKQPDSIEKAKLAKLEGRLLADEAKSLGCVGSKATPTAGGGLFTVGGWFLCDFQLIQLIPRTPPKTTLQLAC